MNTKPLRFLRRGQVVTLTGVETNRTLLDLLRDDLLWQSAVDRKNILGQTDKSNE